MWSALDSLPESSDVQLLAASGQSEEEWEDLWNDVPHLRRQPDDRHYTGALVVQGRSDREFTIIDGQQRLATISILSLAVIARLHRMADEGIDAERNVERANGLRNRFVGQKDPASSEIPSYFTPRNSYILLNI